MNLREWVLPLSLAVITTFVFQYFLGPKTQGGNQQTVQSGQSFVAPSLQTVNKPLNVHVDFVRDNKQVNVETKTVSTKLASYTFSNKGAVLEKFDFPWQRGTETISSLVANEECFLLGLDKDTPLMYEVVNIVEDQDSDASITYKAPFKGGFIYKTFVMNSDSYKVQLKVTLDIKDKTEQVVRLFVAQPIMHPTISWDTLSGVVNGSGGTSITEINVKKEKSLSQYWVAPSSFGYSSKFLVHALTQDVNHSLQRAYFRKDSESLTTAILETKPLKSGEEFVYEFFVGPKTVAGLEKVDPRLTGTLNYGWFAGLSKPMLHLLNYLNEKTGSYGWAIILLTMLIKLLLLPFTLRGERNMRKGVDMQKKLAYLQQKYKNDRASLDRERAELIRKHGMPGISGCLPMLLNIPMFIALNKVLSNAIELYGANFLWISNLSEKDPYYILPIITGLAMCFNPMGPATGGNDLKQGMSRYAIALVLATVTSYLSAGLTLFICINTVLSVAQTSLQKK